MTTGTIIIVAALFTISESIQAQAPNGGNQTISVAQLVAAQCPKFTSQLVDRPELKLIASVLGCLTPELERALAATPPTK